MVQYTTIDCRFTNVLICAILSQISILYEFGGAGMKSRGRIAQCLSGLIGTRVFYQHVISIVIPIIIQNTVSNVVSLLDNVMIGRVGTLEMSAVAIANQLFFVF